ncbi:MAG: AAA family ATPase [Myxococcaceae bacterium]
MSSLLLEPELPDRVRRYLRDALPGASIGPLDVADGRPSLLLMQINQILAVFAFGTDDVAYRELYSGFKKHFLSDGEQWRSLDVSFVYCLPQSARPTDAFCSEVEADVYFCRKFIVSVSNDIASSLLRLPFLPLAPLTGSPLRPPSAQTLLQRSNVGADLARFLVVQNARGAQSILADCLADKFGDPEPPTEARTTQEPKQERALNPVSLESLTIQNFRAYRKSKTFTFGSAITVLYGPNGFGKTSFFDALDFAVTGGIGRLPSTATDQALVKAARHLDTHDEPCTVTLTFKRGQESHTVVRDLSDPKQAKLDSKKGIGRKEVLTTLTGGEGPAADRVENFVSLFRATHLFSQERQELTQDFQVRSELSSDLVSRMLAFEERQRYQEDKRGSRTHQKRHSAR